MTNKVPIVKLNNGVEMPQFGLGVWKAEDGEEVQTAISEAFQAGYRLIDTAKVYGNEQGVGQAIKDSGLDRKEIFLTTKLWNQDQGYESAFKALDGSLERLGLDYVDLYLIHWPQPEIGKFKETWRAMEEMQKEGKIRAIGVSNFKPEHLEELIKDAKIVPAVNQIELHPLMSQTEARKYCDEKGIKVESWSPLMRAGTLLENQVIVALAEKYNKEAAQVVLRWHIQSDLIVIPKSVTPKRIRSNIDIFDFELSDADMEKIDGLNESRRVGPNPDNFNS